MGDQVPGSLVHDVPEGMRMSGGSEPLCCRFLEGRAVGLVVRA